MVAAYAVGVVLFVYCLLNLATTPARDVRALPKALWFVVLLVPLVGPIAWLLCGRPQRATRRSTPAPDRAAPDDDEDFLRELRRRADDQRRRARDPRDDDGH